MAEINSLNLINEIRAAVKEVQKNGGWLILVCPSFIISEDCGKILSLMVPIDTVSGGRTFKFPNNGYLSVANVNEALFVPEGTNFSVAFIGWTAKDDEKGLTKWMNKTTKIFKW